MVNLLIWLAATAAMFSSDSGLLPFAAAVLLAAILAPARNSRRKSRLAALVSTYISLYGEAPPGFDITATRAGAGVGGATGNYAAGSLIGAAVDVGRTLWNERAMTPEQKAVHQQIKSLQACSPWHGLWLLIFGLAMSWMTLGVWHIVGSG